MVDNGIICRKQRGKYVLHNDSVAKKIIYRPQVNEQLQEISEKIESKFPFVKFVIFESVQLNEFLNHLIGRNTFFVLVEKDGIEEIFEEAKKL